MMHFSTYNLYLLIFALFTHTLYPLPAQVLDVLESYHNRSELDRYFSDQTIEELTTSWNRRISMLNGLLRTRHTPHDLETIIAARSALTSRYLDHVDRLLTTSARVGAQQLLGLSSAEEAWLATLADTPFEQTVGLDTKLLEQIAELVPEAVVNKLRASIEAHQTRLHAMLKAREKRARKNGGTQELFLGACHAVGYPDTPKKRAAPAPQAANMKQHSAKGV